MKSGNQTRIEDLSDLVPPESDMTASTLLHHGTADSSIHSNRHDQIITRISIRRRPYKSSVNVIFINYFLRKIYIYLSHPLIDTNYIHIQRQLSCASVHTLKQFLINSIIIKYAHVIKVVHNKKSEPFITAMCRTVNNMNEVLR